MLARVGRLAAQDRAGKGLLRACLVDALQPTLGARRAAKLATLAKLAKLAKLRKLCNFLAGSFSAESKRNFARKYALDSIF